MNKCKVCGKNSESEYCFRHKPRKRLAARSNMKKSVEPRKRDSTMRDLFMEIWRERPHVSEVSGEVIFSPPSSANFHHILHKEIYKELMYCKENIIILTIDEHTNCHNGIIEYDEVENRKKQLQKEFLNKNK